MNFHISYEQALSNVSTWMAMLAEFEPARNPSVQEEWKGSDSLFSCQTPFKPPVRSLHALAQISQPVPLTSQRE